MVTYENYRPRNHFVIDRTIFVNTLLPPLPKHFVYRRIDRKKLCFYRPLMDKNDPPPPASLLRLSKMSVKKLKAIASKNDLGGWAGLGKADLVKIFEKA